MGEWVTRGFNAFSRGAFGNAGQNLYVSRAGVLQRIFHFDLNLDGNADLVFCARTTGRNTADSQGMLADSLWTGLDGKGSWLDGGDSLPDLKRRWIQYQLALGARNGCDTPRVTQVRVTYG